MSAEASAVLDAMSGYIAYDVGVPGFPETWIWDGFRARYYNNETRHDWPGRLSDHTPQDIERLIADEQCSWTRIPVPSWFTGHRAQ